MVDYADVTMVEYIDTWDRRQQRYIPDVAWGYVPELSEWRCLEDDVTLCCCGDGHKCDPSGYCDS